MNSFQDCPSTREEALGEALDRIWEAVAMLGPCGQVVYANRAAAGILHRGDGLGLSPDGRLLTQGGEAREAVARVLTDKVTPAPVAVPRAGQPPLVLSLQPLPAALVGAFGAVALMFISDPCGKPIDRSAALRSAFGLTSTEARLAQSLSEGASLKEIAGANDITYETVRTHVRRILNKVGVRRQADLVRVAHALR